MLNNRITELYERAGFKSDGHWPNIYSVGAPLEKLVAIVIDECAQAAAEHANSYSDGCAGTGAAGAAEAVRSYGVNLLK